MEREAFQQIERYHRTLFSENAKAAARLEAVRYFFCHGEDRQWCLADAVGAISSSIRIDVIRLRVVYEMWLRKLRFTGPISVGWVLPCPETVRSNATWHGGDIGGALVEVAWQHPGLSVQEAFARARELVDVDDTKRLQESLSRLVEEYIVSMAEVPHEGEMRWFLWVTGRNPVLELDARARETLQRSRPGNYSWSRLF